MIRQLFLLIAVASVALAAVYQIPLETKPEEYKDCDGCWLSEIEEFIPTNGTRPVDNGCARYLCTPEDVQVQSCGAIGYDKDKCYEITDLSQEYPGCCPKVVCPDSPASGAA